MQVVISQEKKRPLSYEMLATLVPKWCRVVKYDSLANKKTLKDALAGKEMLVVLYNVHSNTRKKLVNMPGHFIVINARSKKQPVEYFSSSGWSAAQELAATHSDPNIFKRLLPKDFVYNTTKFEGEGDINTCWRWCLARCVLGHISLKDFQKLFRQKVIVRSTDDAVILMTLLKTIEHDLQ